MKKFVLDWVSKAKSANKFTLVNLKAQIQSLEKMVNSQIIDQVTSKKKKKMNKLY